MILSIKKATNDNLDEVYLLELSTYKEYSWTKETIKQEINSAHSYFYVACIDANIIAYICMWRINTEGHLINLVVTESYRRRHIADILLYNIILLSIKQGVTCITLEVREGNKSASSLYKKFLFKLIGRRKGYYQNNNEDALILWLHNINSESYLNHLNTIYKKDSKDYANISFSWITDK